MAALTPTNITTAGVAVSAAAAAGGGDSFANTGNEFLYVNNGSGSSINVTFAVQSTKYLQEVVGNRVVAVGAGAAKLIGPFPPALFNDANGAVQVTYSGVTSLTVAVFRYLPTLG